MTSSRSVMRRTTSATTAATTNSKLRRWSHHLILLLIFAAILHGVWLNASSQIHPTVQSLISPLSEDDATTTLMMPSHPRNPKRRNFKADKYQAKRKRTNLQLLPNNTRIRSNTTIKVPFPIFVASLPKSGTTSVHNYFFCGKIRSAHTYCPDEGKRISYLIRSNLQNGTPLLQGCGDGISRKGPVHVFSDTGDVPPGGPCFYPSVSALNELVESYPNMTLVLGTRNPIHWYNSLEQWGHGRMFRRWGHFCSFMPRRNRQHLSREALMADYIHFYHWHTQHIRNFTQQHPSITYIEFAIDVPDASLELERATGISASCWGNYRPAPA